MKHALSLKPPVGPSATTLHKNSQCVPPLPERSHLIFKSGGKVFGAFPSQASRNDTRLDRAVRTAALHHLLIEKCVLRIRCCVDRTDVGVGRAIVELVGDVVHGNIETRTGPTVGKPIEKPGEPHTRDPREAEGDELVKARRILERLRREVSGVDDVGGDITGGLHPLPTGVKTFECLAWAPLGDSSRREASVQQRFIPDVKGGSECDAGRSGNKGSEHYVARKVTSRDQYNVQVKLILGQYVCEGIRSCDLGLGVEVHLLGPFYELEQVFGHVFDRFGRSSGTRRRGVPARKCEVQLSLFS
jgi:hypothetical protein